MVKIGYLSIPNLYKDTSIMMFNECYAMEKIHGTSAHIAFKDGQIRFFAGGGKHASFLELFDVENLEKKFNSIVDCDMVIYGESYGGKQQGMSNTYGKEPKFIVFDVKIGDKFVSVPQAEEIALSFGLEFVSYNQVKTDIESLNAERDLPSVQAKRNGIVEDKMREGVVLRPLAELTQNNGKRIIVKHKRAEFSETKTPREVDPAQLKILDDAKEIAEEWVTENRLDHVLDHLGNPSDFESTSKVIKEMISDVMREAKGEIVFNKSVPKAIGTKCAKLYKARITSI